MPIQNKMVHCVDFANFINKVVCICRMYTPTVWEAFDRCRLACSPAPTSRGISLLVGGVAVWDTALPFYRVSGTFCPGAFGRRMTDPACGILSDSTETASQ